MYFAGNVNINLKYLKKNYSASSLYIHKEVLPGIHTYSKLFLTKSTKIYITKVSLQKHISGHQTYLIFIG